MASLVYRDSAGRQVVYPLEKERISIGRGVDNDIVSIDPRVSRRHASLSRTGDGGGFTIRDEASSLGLFVNLRRVTEAPLRDGDVIRIGDSTYSYVAISKADDVPTLDLSGAGEQVPGDAGLRGTALVAELQEATASLRSGLGSPRGSTGALEASLALVDERLESLRRHLVRIERGRMMMESLHQVGKIINSSYERENLLEIILSLAVQVVRAERGFLTLFDAESGAFTRRAAINMGEAGGADRPRPAGAPGQEENRARDFSTGIALAVARSGNPVVTTDAQTDERFRDMESVADLNIRSALCVPLVDRASQVMGVIYLDTRASVVLFTRDDQEFLTAFANYASIAIDNARLFSAAAARARAEEELRQARRMDAMKSDLISIVSHDVRTPLTSIKSYAEILYDDLESLDPAQQRQYLQVINREADRLSRLVTNYLDLQRIEAGMMRLSIHPVETAALVDESLASFEGAALQKDIKLSRDVEPSPPTIQGDRDRLLQVLANLLSNAIKFTPSGGSVVVSLRRAEIPAEPAGDGSPGVSDGAMPAVKISVSDTGGGIPPEKVGSLFQRFGQVGSDRSERRQGTGLGLYFSREIVELHGGWIAVTSVPGQGATFEVLLPVEHHGA